MTSTTPQPSDVLLGTLTAQDPIIPTYLGAVRTRDQYTQNIVSLNAQIDSLQSEYDRRMALYTAYVQQLAATPVTTSSTTTTTST